MQMKIHLVQNKKVYNTTYRYQERAAAEQAAALSRYFYILIRRDIFNKDRAAIKICQGGRAAFSARRCVRGRNRKKKFPKKIF